MAVLFINQRNVISPINFTMQLDYKYFIVSQLPIFYQSLELYFFLTKLESKTNKYIDLKWSFRIISKISIDKTFVNIRSS